MENLFVARELPREGQADVSVDPYRLLLRRGTMQDRPLMIAVVGLDAEGKVLAYASLAEPVVFVQSKLLQWQLTLIPNQGEVTIGPTGCFQWADTGLYIGGPGDKDCDQDPVETDCDDTVPFVCDDSLFCIDKTTETQHTAFGMGEESDPYLICTVQQLVNIGLNPGDWGAHFRLMTNLDLKDYDEDNYTIIGNELVPFTGTFDGGNHIISNFTYRNEGGIGVGLFGNLNGPKSEIRNLHLTNVQLLGKEQVGALVGILQEGRIMHSSAQGVVEANSKVGGLIGDTAYGMISSSSADVQVKAWDSGNYLGGLIGYSQFAILINSYAVGDVLGEGSSQRVGGLQGDSNKSHIHNCYATGNVTGGNWVGGFAGHDNGSLTRNSFALGSVSVLQEGGSVSLFVASTNGTIASDNNFYNQAADCAGVCDNTRLSPTGIDLSTNPEYFHADLPVLNEPVSSWDFVYSWQVRVGELPRPAPTFLNTTVWGECGDHLDDLPFAGGVGTAENPYLICSASQLQALGADPTHWQNNRHYKLMRDIDMASLNEPPNIIGSANVPFKGYFNGNSHRILNLVSRYPKTDDVGLFGKLDESRVERVAIENAQVVGRQFVGIVAGYARIKAQIRNVFVTGNVSGLYEVGSVVGWCHYCKISSSYSTAGVRGTWQVGGFVGNNQNGKIDHVFAVGPVDGDIVSGQEAIDIGRLEGSSFEASLTEAYYDESSLCRNCTTATGTPVNLLQNPDWFFHQTNLPLAGWDFGGVWKLNTNAFPTFQ